MKPHESKREAIGRELDEAPGVAEEPRAHLWDTLPVRCWCGETHVIGLDDADYSSADDANAPGIDERIEQRAEDE